MIHTLSIPSEVNEIELIAENGKPFQTQTRPFYFYYVDECGNDEEIDITSYTFSFKVFFNDCLYLDSYDLVIEAPNKLYLNLSSVTLPKGQYDYLVEVDGGNSVIKGKFIVK